VFGENWNSKWFGDSKIEIQWMVYYRCFHLSYFLPKTHPIFLIYYKFANVGYYSKSFLGVAKAKPWNPPAP